MPVKVTKTKALLSSIFDSLFFLHSAQINSFYTKFLQLNLPIRMRKMSFTKLKAISHSLCKALGIPICCGSTKIRLLYIAKIYISWSIFKFKRRHLTGTFNRVRGWEGRVHRWEFSLHHDYKQNFRRKNVTEFFVVFNILLYYTIIQLLTIAFT